MSISINKKVKFDGAGCPFSTFLRLQGVHHCACAQKWCHFSLVSKSFQAKKIKALRPKMTKVASRGSCLKTFTTDSCQPALILFSLIYRRLHSYLCNRRQNVAVGNPSCPSFYCTKPLQQENVLSPLLFHICLSDLQDLAKQNNSTLRSFADDMTLYHSDISPVQASKSVCAGVSTLNYELMELGLPTDIEKSAVLYIHPSVPIRKCTPSTRTPTVLRLNRTPIKIGSS